MRSFRCSVLVTFVLVGVARMARADEATAEALFEEGRVLMERGDYEQACPKLAASYKLDLALGTLLNLALCHERVGRIATAWLEYVDGAAAAKSAHDDERLRFANERAALLEPRLSHLVIRRSAAAPAQLVVTRDGVELDPAALGTSVPIDPGRHEVRARAPGRKEWSTTVDAVTEGSNVSIDVPALEDARPPKPEDRLPLAKGTSRQHVAAAVVGVFGLATIGVGASFGLLAWSRWSDAQPHCKRTPSGLGCDPVGLSAAGDATTFATVSTVGFVVGAAALAGGVALWLLTPRSKAHSIALAPVWLDGLGLAFAGAF